MTMTTNPTQATHFSLEFPADSEFFDVHPLDESTAEDDALFFDGMDFIDEDAMIMDFSGADKIEPLHMSKQGSLDAIQEDDASYLLSNLQGDGACTIHTKNQLNTSSSSASVVSSSTSSNNGMQRSTSINDQLQTLAASMKRTEETRKHIIAQRQMLSPEQKTVLGMATEQLKRSRLDFITGSGLLSSLM